MPETLSNHERWERLPKEGLRKVSGVRRDEYDLDIYAGWNEDIMNQLIAKSRQNHIFQATRGDAERRFPDEESFKDWLAGGRKLYPMVGESKDLAGIIWYGKSSMPEDFDISNPPEHTFAIRLYEGYTGKQLAPEFMQTTLIDFLTENPDAENGVWLQTDITNEKAYNLYKKFGYKEIGRSDKRITMVFQKES